MGLGCGMSLVKYLLFIFNLICALCGIAIMAIGITTLLKIKELDKVFEQLNVTAMPIAMIVVGGVIFVIAFFGCCGAISESHSMTMTYSSLMMLLIIAQIVMGVMVFVYEEEISVSVNKVFNNIWENREQKANEEFLNIMQTNLKCCGLNSPLDWVVGLNKIPQSCCVGQDTVLGSCNPLTANQMGCKQGLRMFIQDSSQLVGILILAVAGIELMCFIFGCCFANNLRNQQRRSAYQ